MNYKAHSSAIIDSPVEIGENTRIWHFCHVSKNVIIGNDCTFGQNVFIGEGVKIGNSVKVQNNVSIYAGCELEDEVFLGPSCVLTNVSNPRSQINRKGFYEKTVFKKGSTIGANSTITCGLVIGKYSFVAAGTVITKDVKDYALVMGNPGRQVGWMSRHGHRLISGDSEYLICPESKLRYKLEGDQLYCIDIKEEDSLPTDLTLGKDFYRSFKK